VSWPERVDAIPRGARTLSEVMSIGKGSGVPILVALATLLEGNEQMIAERLVGVLAQT
jgi:hypothetical protein